MRGLLEGGACLLNVLSASVAHAIKNLTELSSAWSAKYHTGSEGQQPRNFQTMNKEKVYEY
jgi:hypothetical protein